MQKNIIEVETKNYGIVSERIIYVDKIAAERAARAGGWSLHGDEITLMAFWAWHVLKRTHVIPETLKYEDFRDNELIDANVEQSDLDPTQAGLGNSN